MSVSPIPREISSLFARAMAGVDGETSCVLPDGRSARLERNPDHSVRLRVRLEGADPEEVFPLTAFNAAKGRPPGYPPDLPFIINVPVTLGIGRGQRFLAWLEIPDTTSLVEELSRQSIQNGWVVDATKDEPLASTRVLRKDGLERFLMTLSIPALVEMLERQSSGHR